MSFHIIDSHTSIRIKVYFMEV